MKIIYFIFLVVILISYSAYSANHYVRSGAIGLNNGSDWANAYTSLPTSLIRGDTYYIADGSYSGKNFNTPVAGAQLITIKKAIESDHGTDVGWSSTYGDGQAVFTSVLFLLLLIG
jgi:hypothetical protein